MNRYNEITTRLVVSLIVWFVCIVTALLIWAMAPSAQARRQNACDHEWHHTTHHEWRRVGNLNDSGHNRFDCTDHGQWAEVKVVRSLCINCAMLRTR